MKNTPVRFKFKTLNLLIRSEFGPQPHAFHQLPGICVTGTVHSGEDTHKSIDKT